jgi:hypothetical protein
MAEPSEIAANFQNLSATASLLNKSSDELTSAVGLLDAALQKLNVGLAAWVTFAEWADEHGSTGSREQVGYEKVNGKWGISLRVSNWDMDMEEIHGPWLFTDASRELRLAAVDKLPALVQELNRKATETVKKVQEKTEQTRTLIAALASLTAKDAAKNTGRKTSMIAFKALPATQVSQIKSLIRVQRPDVDELLRYAVYWAYEGGILTVYFSQERAKERVRFEQSGLTEVADAASRVLNAPIKVCVGIAVPHGRQK